MKVSRSVAALAGASFVIVGLAGPALAEGTFSSSISNAATTFESRQWQDNNLDSTNGYVNFKNCQGTIGGVQVSVDVGIYKEDAGPDTQVGREWLQCQKGSDKPSDSVYAGDVGKDQYHFTIKGLQNAGKNVDVQAVKVVY